MPMADHAHLERLARELVDAELLIETGSINFCKAGGLEDAPEMQLDDMQFAFFTGARHVFYSIIYMLVDSSGKTTDIDLMRLEKIERELCRFRAEYAAQHLPAAGSA
jgi:hypothetical protein